MKLKFSVLVLLEKRYKPTRPADDDDDDDGISYSPFGIILKIVFMRFP